MGGGCKGRGALLFDVNYYGKMPAAGRRQGAPPKLRRPCDAGAARPATEVNATHTPVTTTARHVAQKPA